MSASVWWRSALWRKAPFVLLRHPSAFVAVLVAGFLVGLAASSSPLVTTAAASTALKNELADLSPLATGLEISAPLDPIGPAGGLRAAGSRRASAGRRLAGELGLEQPVLTEESVPVSVLNGDGGTQVVLMARSRVLGHVKVLEKVDGDGVWLSDLTARSVGIRAGGELRLDYSVHGGGPIRSARLRVKGIYRALDGSAPNPYWANFQTEIFPPGLDPPAPVRYVFMSPTVLYGVADRLSSARTFKNRGRTFHVRDGPGLTAITELAVDPSGLTLPRARVLAARFADLRGLVRSSELGRELGCALPSGLPSPNRGLLCSLSSSLSAAVTLADENASEISPIVTLLSAAGTAVALAVAAAAGLFLVRRRAGETALLFVRGEHLLGFATRTAVEVFLPTLVGAAAGFGLALGLTGTFAPAGSVDAGTVGSALVRGGLAAGAGLLLAVVVASVLFVRQFDAGVRRRRWLRWLAWELPLLVVAAWLLEQVVSGGGLAGSGGTGTRHLTLPVFAVPLLLVAGVAGLVARAARAGLHLRRGGRLPVAVFLAVRRLSAARGVLVAILVVSAVSFGAYFYSASLSSSLTRSVTEKAYIGYGGDAQGIVDPQTPIPRGLPYSVTEAVYGNQAASLGSPNGTTSDLLAIDPATLGSVIRWYRDWGPDPRPLLGQLQAVSAGQLPVIVTTSVPSGLKVIWVQGVRLPVRVVARVSAFPGMSAGIPLVAVSGQALAAAAARAHLVDPLGDSQTYVWAKGPPERAARELQAAPLRAYYVVSVRSFTNDPAVLLAKRTFGYMRLIAAAAGLLVLVGLLLYLQARQRTQAVFSALAGRMGLSRRTEILSLTLELAAIGLLSATVGGLVALFAASPIVGHIDPLPENPPAPSLEIPLEAIVLTTIGLLAVVVLAGLVTSWASRRTDMGEALRVV